LNANAKSPISGGIGDSQSGGFFPAELKFAGFDGIVIKGKSPSLCTCVLWMETMNCAMPRI
jgi:aldehyde:ferredoxin oxidoreductase